MFRRLMAFLFPFEPTHAPGADPELLTAKQTLAEDERELAARLHLTVPELRERIEHLDQAEKVDRVMREADVAMFGNRIERT